MSKPAPLPVPAALARKGIEGITSNLPADKTIDVAGAFLKIFGDEAQAALRKHALQNNAAGALEDSGG